jgi:ankyrin repeat protein
MNENSDIFHKIREYIITPCDYFRFRSASRVLSSLPGVFWITSSDLCRLAVKRKVPLCDMECSKLRIYSSESPSILTKHQNEALLFSVERGCGSNLFHALLQIKASDPFLLYDSALKLDRSDVALLCVSYFPMGDPLRIWRRLRAAVVRGCLDIVENIVEAGITVDTLEADSDPLLHAAIMHNHFSIAQFLLDAGVSLAERDSDGLTPFLLACKEQRAEIVQLFLDRDPTLIAQRDNEGRSCVCLALMGPTLPSSSALLGILIDAGASFTTVVMPNGMLPIQFACATNKVDQVKVLVSKGVSLSQTDTHGRSCLDVAFMSYEMISYLLSQGLPVNQSTDYLGRAAAHNELQLCQVLHERGVRIKSPNSLLAAVSTTSENSLCVEYLLSVGADPNDCATNGETPLYRAVVYRNLGACELLLKHKADPNTQFNGLSVTDIAQREGFLDINQILSNFGATSHHTYRQTTNSS